jgi:hypothetical protein
MEYAAHACEWSLTMTESQFDGLTKGANWVYSIKSSSALRVTFSFTRAHKNAFGMAWRATEATVSDTDRSWLGDLAEFAQIFGHLRLA